jgi:hypothetical protein
MISKRQKWILWVSFVLLILLSAFGVVFGFSMRAIVPMALNDSSPNFSQIADADRWDVYHEAQSLIGPIALVMLALTVSWAVLAGFSIWQLSKKSDLVCMKSSDDFFTIEQRIERLYEEGRQLFLRGKHEEALDRFKHIYEDTVVFRDVGEIVDDYYAKPEQEWLAKYRARFERQNGAA